MSMALFAASYLGGALTILSPCILPIIPVLFARAGRSFTRSTVPMLAGLALSFAAVAVLAAVGGGWAVTANEYARRGAVILLAAFGLGLLVPSLAELAARPFTNLADRLAAVAGTRDGTPTMLGSVAIGAATGLLWSPCAGPVLGLVLTGAALNGPSVGTAALLLAYAVGAATSLAVALLAGRRLAVALRGMMRGGMALRRVAGVAVLASAGMVVSGVDSGVLARASLTGTTALEQGVLDRLRAVPPSGNPVQVAQNGPAALPYRSSLPVQGAIPALDGAVEWINTIPQSAASLRGKVVLVDFWTYSCINCIRTTPYLRAWAEKYRDQGLVVLGVHTPEFAFEKRLANVRRAVSDFGITYPVAVDSDFRIWRAFGNNSWPAFYLVDVQGRIRHRKSGEGEYDRMEQAIQDLLREAGSGMGPGQPATLQPRAIEAAPDLAHIRTGETYVGYQQATGFASTEPVKADQPSTYSVGDLRVNQWGLSGRWVVEAERAVLDAPGGGIAFRFDARDLHLVLGRGASARPVRFQVTIDGHAPGPDHGADTDAEGFGSIDATRLYQLVRQSDVVSPRRFEIRFLDLGAEAYSFTFG